MKKYSFYIISFLFVILYGNDVFSQNDTINLMPLCIRDTTIIKIEKINEYLYVEKKHQRGKSARILIYVINARYADTNHKQYKEPLIIVSMDTIKIHKKCKSYYYVNGINRYHTIKEGDTRLFHLELYGCLPIIGGLKPSFFDVDRINLPIEICPLQPFKAKELSGLNYSDAADVRSTRSRGIPASTRSWGVPDPIPLIVQAGESV